MSGDEKLVAAVILLFGLLVAAAAFDRAAGRNVIGCGVRVEFNSASRDAGGE